MKQGLGDLLDEPKVGFMSWELEYDAYLDVFDEVDCLLVGEHIPEAV
jgi:hypothetical protein